VHSKQVRPQQMRLQQVCPKQMHTEPLTLNIAVSQIWFYPTRSFPNGELSRDGSPRDGARSGGLLARSLWVTPPNADGRLWAVDLALRSPAVGVVLADGSGFSMAATRRVQLLAAEHGVGALLVRPPWERGELSAAQTRWQVCWHPARAVGADGVPRPRWLVEVVALQGSANRENTISVDFGVGR
jgi:hypothetical protein